MKSLRKRVQQRGFSLVEMAIVLVIIGLIVAAVTVGKDTMRTAENNKVYNKFIAAWTQAAYAHFNRTGYVPHVGTPGPVGTPGNVGCVEHLRSVNAAVGKSNSATKITDVAGGCVQAMRRIGIDLPSYLDMTNDEGELVQLRLNAISDFRSAALRDANNGGFKTTLADGTAESTDGGTVDNAELGGMIVFFEGPMQLAIMADAQIDAGNVDATGAAAVGGEVGDVVWKTTVNDANAYNGAAGVEQSVVGFSIRLRDISGTGSGGVYVADAT